MTLCFTPAQALLAAKAGANYISPFVGRLDDIATSGMGLIQQIVQIYENYDYSTEVLVASVRGYAPSVAVEFARKLLFSEVRPTFADLEDELKGRTKAA